MLPKRWGWRLCVYLSLLLGLLLHYREASQDLSNCHSPLCGVGILIVDSLLSGIIASGLVASLLMTNIFEKSRKWVFISISMATWMLVYFGSLRACTLLLGPKWEIVLFVGVATILGSHHLLWKIQSHTPNLRSALLTSVGSGISGLVLLSLGFHFSNEISKMSVPLQFEEIEINLRALDQLSPENLKSILNHNPRWTFKTEYSREHGKTLVGYRDVWLNGNWEKPGLNGFISSKAFASPFLNLRTRLIFATTPIDGMKNEREYNRIAEGTKSAKIKILAPDPNRGKPGFSSVLAYETSSVILEIYDQSGASSRTNTLRAIQDINVDLMNKPTPAHELDN